MMGHAPLGSLSLAWVCEGPVTMVCQAMRAGRTEEVLTVEKLGTGRVGLAHICPPFHLCRVSGGCSWKWEGCKPATQHYNTTTLGASHSHVTRGHHTPVSISSFSYLPQTYFSCLLFFRERDHAVLFNDALNTFYLWLYGVRHMVKNHSDRKRGNPLPPHRLLFHISSKGSFICIIPQTR